MNKKSLSLFALAAATLACGIAGAADVDGKWVGKVGDSDITFQLKADGEKLTGTLENAAQPGPVEIKDGTVKGDQITFHVVRNLQNAEAKVQWTGKLAGNELRLQRGAVSGNAVAEVVATRAQP